MTLNYVLISSFLFIQLSINLIWIYFPRSYRPKFFDLKLTNRHKEILYTTKLILLNYLMHLTSIYILFKS